MRQTVIGIKRSLEIRLTRGFASKAAENTP